MNLVVINGSYRKEGITSSLVDRFLEGVHEQRPGAEVTYIHLQDKEIEFCNACRNCCRRDGQPLGKCLKTDDVAPILQMMLGCDRLILATPVHMGGTSARMKQFIERCIPAVTWDKLAPEKRNRPERHKLGGFLLSTAAPSPINRLLGLTRYPSRVLNDVCKLFGCGQIRGLYAGAMQTSPRARDKFLQKAYRMGRHYAA